MDLKTILSLVVLGVDCIVVLFYVVLFIINKAKKYIAKEDYELKNDELESINKLVGVIIPKAIEVAEKVKGVPGAVKKNLALGDVMQECISQGIDYEAHKEFIDNQIESSIKFTKEVNSK